MKTALITGITGQDGGYLAKLLLEKGYAVIGITRSYLPNISNLNYLNIHHQVTLEECDLSDLPFVLRILEKYRPTEIYNLAAQSSVGHSFQQPISTIQFNVNSVLNLLEAIRMVNSSIKFYQASSSEMFGRVEKLPITLSTPMHPLSPYAISKASNHWTVVNFRESFGLFACNGVLFNHESFLRANNFFVKKIITESLKIKAGLSDKLKVGNIDVKRDFGFAPRYVEAMWLMLQQEKPRDFIICSGKSISLRSIIEHVFQTLDLPMSKLEIDRNLYRPIDIDDIYGDNSDAKTFLRWSYDHDFRGIIDLLLKEEYDSFASSSKNSLVKSFDLEQNH
jgi:GDPmannose 4,6-dehydratase